MDAGGEGEELAVALATSRYISDGALFWWLKVKHLEVSCSSMAEDICRKSAIIEAYVMDSRRGETRTRTSEFLWWSGCLTPPLLLSSDVSGPGVGGHGGSLGDRGGLGSVLRDLVKPGDENLREMNKKLQNMLEEQLTKNMHLQKVKTAGSGPAQMFKTMEINHFPEKP